MPARLTQRQRFHLRVTRFVRDRRSGAAELAVTATTLLDEARRAGYDRQRFCRLQKQLVDAHPAMGSIFNAVHTDDATHFREALQRDLRRTVREARRLLPRNARVITLSYSSTVFAALDRRDLTVTVAESLPGGEGIRVARRRRRRGLPTRVVPDATLALATEEADCAMVGADAVTPHFVVNKVGTHLLALACGQAGIPCYALADPSKWVPGSWPIPIYSPSRPFERTPRRLFGAIISAARQE